MPGVDDDDVCWNMEWRAVTLEVVGSSLPLTPFDFGYKPLSLLTTGPLADC